ncbi:MAG: M81 family metallopeptidase [Peptostreptococcaceae bacterium]|nr:M81 family metallopeptidase [Peptostreptococcaceae bacterium]
MKYKIAVGGIHIESSTFTPYISGESDFTMTRGDELLARYPWLSKYRERVEMIPLLHARALPGGAVSRSFFENWLAEFISRLEKAIVEQGIDALLLDIHGAMVVENMTDAEGFVAEKLRAVMGNRIISASMDLHGNVSDRLFDSCDMLSCYRTAPHIDVHETRERAFSHILFALENPQKIFKVKVDVPILLPGEKTSTEVEPGKSLYAMVDDFCMGDLLDISIYMGFPWADESRCHGAVVALGVDEKKTQEFAQKTAEAFWANRDKFSFVGPTDTPENSIHQALSFQEKTFFISDTGDNPGAGGAGDMNLLLRDFFRINEQEKIEKKVLFASIYDSESIEKIYAKSIGEKVSIDLGGKVDISFGGPLSLEVKIEYLFELERAGKGALVRHDNLFIIVTQNRFQYGKKEFFIQSGVGDFSEFDVIIVKMGYLEPDLSRAAKGWVMALTAGAVPQDIVNIKYRHLARPLYPFDEIEGEALRMRKGFVDSSDRTI